LLLTSIAFGLFHDPSFRNLSYSFLAFLYGLVLGSLFLYTGNIWAPIFAHATHNLLTLLVLRYWVKPPASPVIEP
jgi:membrane protease YdiL (CAAX protease family)